MTLAELNEQIMVVPFVEMEPHLKRGAIITLDESLDLAEVALLVAKDDAQAIGGLVEKNLITKASSLDFETWRREKRFFRILIVQPFVLAQNFVALAEPKPN